jgi:hypothetical protein
MTLPTKSPFLRDSPTITSVSQFLVLLYSAAAQRKGRDRGQAGIPDARCNLFRMPLYASPPRDHV